MAEEDNCSVSSYSESGEEGEEEEYCEEEDGPLGAPLGSAAISSANISMDDLAFVAQIVDQTKNSYYAQQPAGDIVEDLHSIPQNVFPEPNMGAEDEEEDDDGFDSETEEILCGGGAGRDVLADDEEVIAVGPLRTAHEIVETIPPEKTTEEVAAVEIPTNEDIVLIGEIVSQISTEHTLVIKSVKTTAPLDEGSLLCLENRHPIGRVNEIFGPLSQPFYVVRGIITASPSSLASVGRDSKEERAQQTKFDRREGEEEEGEIGEMTAGETTAVVQGIVIAPGIKIYSPMGLSFLFLFI
jgi:rRNA processing protein Gar1